MDCFCVWVLRIQTRCIPGLCINRCGRYTLLNFFSTVNSSLILQIFSPSFEIPQKTNGFLVLASDLWQARAKAAKLMSAAQLDKLCIYFFQSIDQLAHLPLYLCAYVCVRVCEFVTERVNPVHTIINPDIHTLANIRTHTLSVSVTHTIINTKTHTSHTHNQSHTNNHSDTHTSQSTPLLLSHTRSHTALSNSTALVPAAPT